MDLKLGTGKVFDTGNPKMKVPRPKTEVLNVILTLRTIERTMETKEKLEFDPVKLKFDTDRGISNYFIYNNHY